MDVIQLRRAFTDFFVARGHTAVASMGLIPHHPTAPLFTNAGMNQFVQYMLGEEPAPYPRATSIQKCVRLSGKQSDIDSLGKTRRHLTFFEMLGNFSFGDYFKEDAIKMAWELVTETVGFDGDRLWITVHTTDDDAEAIWHESVGVPMERIQRLDTDNFWYMADTGPCGPCSEIHLDCGPEWGEAGGPARGSGDRFVEFWNLVFMQNFLHPDGSLTDLPRRNVDTGGGLERWAMLLQDVPTVFDTDALRPIIAAAEEATGVSYRAGDEAADARLRVLGDHARAMSFLIADGVAPSNEERGYVLRNVIRRAVVRAQQLGIERPVLVPIVAAAVAHMGDAYPELARDRDGILATVEREEERFRHTLRSGSVILDAELEAGEVTGEVAFRLHDTYGFPIELTEEIAAERGVAVDREGFDTAMAQQRTRAKAARKVASFSESGPEAYGQLLQERGTTDFVGYGAEVADGEVLAVLPGAADGTVEIFLDRTPFYAESGGQLGDTGTIETPTGRATVLDTTAPIGGLHRHLARVDEGDVQPGQAAVATVDRERRAALRRNHTGTHLLHAALRDVLGGHVKQQGSLVAPDYLRFDFSHFEPVADEHLSHIEDTVNAQVLANEAVRAYETTMAEAQAMGAIAFFGDKYGDIVRVVEAGHHSIELCGGTHVPALGSIGTITVVKEESIGANMRRVFAVTGLGALERLREHDAMLRRAARMLRANPDELPDAIERALARQKSLEDEIRALRAAGARARAAELASTAVDGKVVARVDGLDQNVLKDLAVELRDAHGIDVVLVVGSPDGARVALAGAQRPGLEPTAPDLVGETAKVVGGGGGGKDPTLAVAGGKLVEQIDAAVAGARRLLGLD